MIAWRFASGADLERFYGERPAQTAKAIVIALDEEPVGLLGLVWCGNHELAFSEMKPALIPHLKSMPVLRAIKAVQRMFADSVLPVLAIKTTDSEILLRLGFVPTQDSEVYRWVNGCN